MKINQCILILLLSNIFLYSSVTHKTTNVMWEDDIQTFDNKLNWDDAHIYCETLNHNGFDDWYLPSISELIQLRNKRKSSPAIIDKIKNINLQFGYWSSTSSDSDKAYNIHFQYGTTMPLEKSNKRNTKCCRKIKGLTSE